ncbi:class I adenylate-forming enzyme family protein [Amycolatopsis nigrescens]|uniref:class I adenylate-forming enzyme family protein n=1 Tax=Amycolatopsis nigrescens TaxID=381445 RepID=UPI000361D34C|nr:AMP-binding protein [Amycolatopsis nigrescens]
MSLDRALKTSTLDISVPNYAAQLEAMAVRNGWLRRTAFFTEEGPWTYGRLYDTAARAVTVLHRHGVRAGDRVMIVAPDSIAWVVAFLATARAGCTVVPVNPDLTAQDHLFMAADCDVKLVVTTEELAGRFDAGRFLDVGRLLAEAAVAGAAAPAPAGVPLYVHYTSGTTGRPKGVVHPQRNPFAYHETVGRAIDVRPDDVTLSVSKLYFTYGFCNSMVFPLFSGSSAVLISDRPAPGMIGELVARYQVSRLYAVPSWFGRMADEADPALFGSVRGAVSGGERFTKDMTDRSAEFLGAPVLNQLGATEIGCAATANTFGHNVPGTIGRAVPGFEVELRDENRRPIGDETEGDMWVRGAAMMREYLNRPDATEAVLVDGWLYTRDRAVRHADGTFTHVARTDDLEMVGGITMSPMEVEDVLRTHRGVREVAVAAVADYRGATKLRAFVVAAPSPPELESELEAELIALARSRLAPYKVPRSVQLVDSLPRTSTGKLRRFVLRQTVENTTVNVTENAAGPNSLQLPNKG